MKRCNHVIVGLGLLMAGPTLAVEQRTRIRGRELLGDVESIQTGGGATCRCEYPGENLYSTDLLGDDFKTVENTLVYPSSHAACVDLWFVCPGTTFVGTPWTYECPSGEQEGTRKRELTTEHISSQEKDDSIAGQRGLNRVREDGRPYYTKESVERNPFPDTFHHLVDEDGPKTRYYTNLPSDNPFCLDQGTMIQSGETPMGDCASQIVSFQKAGDRRPLPGGTSVGNEWYPNLGVKVHSASDGSSHSKFHAYVLDSETQSDGSIYSEYMQQMGLRETLGNVLVPLHREGTGHSMASGDYGALEFDFYYQTYVKDITIANAGAISRIYITQANGERTILQLEDVGLGGVQTVDLNFENVVKLYFVPKAFAAVVDLHICLIRTTPH